MTEQTLVPSRSSLASVAVFMIGHMQENLKKNIRFIIG